MTGIYQCIRILLFLLTTIVISSLFIPGNLLAAGGISIKSETIFRCLERNTATENDKLILPVYEYLRLDYGQTKSKGISFHAYGWGRGDLADSDYYKETSDGELHYAYLQYRKPFSNFKIRLGRQSVFTGVAVGSFDGLRIESELGRFFNISLHRR